MYKRTKITPLQIGFLRENGIRQMWGADYNGEIVQMDNDVLVCLGGQGRMDDFSNHTVKSSCFGVA